MMWTTLGDVLPQAIGIALSPIPIVLVILVLVSARSRTNGPAFALGWFLAIALAVGVVSLLGEASNASTDQTASDGVNLLQVGLGLLFFFLAVRTWRNRPRPGVEAEQPKLFAAADSMSVLMAFGVGALFAVVNPKNLPLEISAGATIARAGTSGGEAVAVIVLFALIASLTVLVPVAAALFFGARARTALDETKDWLMANNATIMVVLFTLLGAKMLGTGLALLG